MAEINNGMSAREIANVAGVAEPIAVVNAKDVHEARFLGFTQDKDRATINDRRERGNVFIDKKENKLQPLTAESFMDALKQEEEAMLKGELGWEGNVKAFLGEPSKVLAVDVDGKVTLSESTASNKKLDRMKSEAAADVAKLEELVVAVGETTIVGAITKIDMHDKEDKALPDKRREHLDSVVVDLLKMDEKRFNKMMKKLGIDPKGINFNSASEAETEISFELIADGLAKQAERTDDGADVKKSLKFKNSLRGWGADNKVVQKWVDKQIELDDSERRITAEKIKNGDNFKALTETHSHFTKLLSRIANREFVNANIKTDVDRGMNEAMIAQKLSDSEDSMKRGREDHEKAVVAGEKLVSMTRQMSELGKFAERQAALSDKIFGTIDTVKALGEDKAKMKEGVETAELPAKIKELVSSETYAAVAKFVETNGVEGDWKLVQTFMGEVKSLMGDTTAQGEVPAEFLQQTILKVGDKEIEVGMVVGVGTDPDVWEISLAQRDPSNPEDIQVNESQVLYIRHEDINKFVADVSASEARLAELTLRLTNMPSAPVAGSEDVAKQHETMRGHLNTVIGTETITLQASKAMLAESLKPLGGAGSTFAEALTQMSASQTELVDQMYNEEFAEAVREVSEMLQVSTSEVTPTMLAVIYAEATHTAMTSKDTLSFLQNHDELMAAAITAREPELKAFANELADLKISEGLLLQMPSNRLRTSAQADVDKMRLEIKRKAAKIGEQLEASFVASMPKVLGAETGKISEALVATDLAKQAKAVLKDRGIVVSTSEAKNLKLIVEAVTSKTGMVSEQAAIITEMRNALSTLTKDSRSATLRRALANGDVNEMQSRILENLDQKYKSELSTRGEIAKTGEKGKEFGEMTPAERAAALIKGDVDLDKMIDSATALEADEVDKMFDALQLVRGPEAVNARAEVVTRIITIVQEALQVTGSMEDLRAIMENNPEGWIEVLQYAADNTTSFRSQELMEDAIEYAQDLSEKKT